VTATAKAKMLAVGWMKRRAEETPASGKVSDNEQVDKTCMCNEYTY
jgi:hypothetical protein